MQATFYCHWCQSFKLLACGYKQMGPRRRQCSQCTRNTKGATHVPPKK